MRVIRKDGSKGPHMSNTHEALNKQYNRIVSKIKVNEEDLSILNDSLDNTDSEWLSCIVSEQKKLYLELEYIEDKIADISNYQG